jgi:CubicO group peptidase (beta-lactamase class C family)
VAGTRFVYSDINFIVLAEIVARTSGIPFDQFVDRQLFLPLGMPGTGFVPSAANKARIAQPNPAALLVGLVEMRVV